VVLFSNRLVPEPEQAVHSVPSRDVRLKGDIHTDAHNFRIEGVVEGNIHATGEGAITLGGLVKGTIFARHLVVVGLAEGTMRITDCLEIRRTGHVEGDVEMGSLLVDEGGVLLGSIRNRTCCPPISLHSRQALVGGSRRPRERTQPGTPCSQGAGRAGWPSR